MNSSKNKKPSVSAAMIGLLVILVVIIAGLKLKVGTQMAVFGGAAVAVFIAMMMGSKWSGIQEKIIENVRLCAVAIIILVMVGVLVGVWIIGGTLPTLIYYGLSVIAPSALVPLTFLLCAVASVFTGTSLGSIATMGIAMVGIGVNMGIPIEVIAGAVVSGSFFGDKMSPMSDTTNVAPAMAGTDLYSHIGSMLYTTVPATIAALIGYIIIGLQYGKAQADTSNLTLMMETLSSNYNIQVLCIIPLLMVLVLSAMRVPSIITMGSSAIVSIVVAVITQGVKLSDVTATAMNGYVSATGVDMIDIMLSRGGVKSMTATIAILMFAGIMAAALQECGILDVLVNQVLMKYIKSSKSLVVSTLIYCYGIVMVTSNQALGIIIPGKTYTDVYEKMDVDKKVLSRCLEDASTIGSAVIPWSTNAAYITTVLGVGLGYIPFAFLCYFVPVVSLFCAFTGFGMWNGKGEPMWKKRSSKIKKQEA